MTLRIVLAEDNYLVREGVEKLINSEPDLEAVASCADYDALLATAATERPDVVVTDIRMPPTGDRRGHPANELREVQPDRGVVVLSQYSDPSYAALSFLESGSKGRAYLLKERVSDIGQLAQAPSATWPGAADRILRDSGVARCFTTTIREGSFSWDYDQEALHYEEDLLAGRYVITTSLDPEQASTENVVRYYRALQRVERRFRVLKDFIGLRPVYHFTERRVRGHIALCVLAATTEAVMGMDLATARVMDPDLEGQLLSARRALGELNRIRRVELDAGASRVTVITRRNALQSQILAAFGVETSDWDRATIA